MLPTRALGTQGLTVSALSSGACVVPPLRSPASVAEIDGLIKKANVDLEIEFGQRSRIGVSDAWLVEARCRSQGHTLLVLRSIGVAKSRRMFLSIRRLPRVVRPGTLTFFYHGWLSFFDLMMMKGGEVEARRLAGASAFVDALVRTSGSPPSTP